MNELQVRLAQSKHQDRDLYFAPEAALVDRVSKSVLSVPYKCQGGNV